VFFCWSFAVGFGGGRGRGAIYIFPETLQLSVCTCRRWPFRKFVRRLERNSYLLGIAYFQFSAFFLFFCVIVSVFICYVCLFCLHDCLLFWSYLCVMCAYVYISVMWTCVWYCSCCVSMCLCLSVWLFHCAPVWMRVCLTAWCCIPYYALLLSTPTILVTEIGNTR